MYVRVRDKLVKNLNCMWIDESQHIEQVSDESIGMHMCIFIHILFRASTSGLILLLSGGYIQHGADIKRKSMSLSQRKSELKLD